VNQSNFEADERTLIRYSDLDDIDILAAIKVWMNHEDKILAHLAKCLVNRNLFKIKLQDNQFKEEEISAIRNDIIKRFGVSEKDAEYLLINQEITSYLYNPKHAKIKILMKGGKVKDFADASDQWSSLAMQKAVSKYYCCYPKKN
jgi:hypothetical protein